MLITVSGYVTYALLDRRLELVGRHPRSSSLSATLTSVAIEFVAFRRVRGASDTTMLLTSFGVHFVVTALFVMFVSAQRQAPSTGRAGSRTRSRSAPIRLEVFDLATLGVTVVTLAATAFLVRRTMFGISLRAAAEDFDAARLMGVRSDRVIQGAFALAGLLAGIASVFILMRSGRTSPNVRRDPDAEGHPGRADRRPRQPGRRRDRRASRSASLEVLPHRPAPGRAGRG